MRKILASVALLLLVSGLAVILLRHPPDDPPDPSLHVRPNPAVPPASNRIRPLFEADQVVLAEGRHRHLSTADLASSRLIGAIALSGQVAHGLAPLTIDYPRNDSILPPEIVPATILWHEEIAEVDTWLFDVALDDASEHIYILSPGNPPAAGRIDPACVAETNEIYRPTPYQASAKAWTPNGPLWETIKQQSVSRAAGVTILGFSSHEPDKALSRGRITITTSKHPVGNPIFYRDVPLAPSQTKAGVVKPLADVSLPLIAWRLRDISQPQSRMLMTGILSCANCHSFSADGKTLGMDLDGPSGDKGAYVIVPLAKQTLIQPEHVISWNSYQDKPKDQKTIGFLSQISPDARYVVTTLNEAVYVQNFTDYKFLQVFYPTRGILGYYSRATDQIKALPGADDPTYVHCDPVWSPDGEHLVFARAEAKDPYPEGGQPAARAADPAETRIQYDLYRIPFDDGRGGQAEPIAGASQNGMSNTFPKVSPDGKWIVFVKCRNGQLMRPDSTLWIVPAAGGTARPMNCNTSRMNSWHSFSANGRWMVFSSKANTPYTQMFLTQIDEDGNDSPAILIPNSTAANRAVNIPEFVNVSYDGLASIGVPVHEHRAIGLRGIELYEKGLLDEALEQFEAAIRSQPDYLEAHVSVAVILIEKGMVDEAADRLEKILKLDPKCWFAHLNLGVILTGRGLLDEALVHFRTAVELQPEQAQTHASLGRALVEKAQLAEATVHFRAALRYAPQDLGNRVNLGSALLQQGILDEAVEQFEQALDIAPRFVHARLSLGRALATQGEFPAAIAQFRKATQIEPDNLGALNDLAWLLATCPKDELRNGAQAVRLAKTACRATGNKDAVLLKTLAAAYAESANWPDAVATATDALELAQPHDQFLAEEIRQDLGRYKQGQPSRR